MGSRARVLECPRCGAPLPRRALLVRLACSYCGAEVVIDRLGVEAAGYRRTLEAYNSLDRAGDASVLLVKGVPWRLLERVAFGHGTDVFLVERATRLSERGAAKLLRAPEDEMLLRNEQTALAALEASDARCAEYFSTLLPQRIAFGRDDGGHQRSS